MQRKNRPQAVFPCLFGAIPILVGRHAGDVLEDLIKIRQAVKIQEFADIVGADITALQHLAGFFHFQPVDILHRRKSRKLLKLLAVHRFADRAAAGQLPLFLCRQPGILPEQLQQLFHPLPGQQAGFHGADAGGDCQVIGVFDFFSQDLYTPYKYLLLFVKRKIRRFCHHYP